MPVSKRVETYLLTVLAVCSAITFIAQVVDGDIVRSLLWAVVVMMWVVGAARGWRTLGRAAG